MSARLWTVGLGLLNQANFHGGTERFEARVGVRLVKHADPWRWRVYTRGVLPAEWTGATGFEEVPCAPTRAMRGGRIWSEQVSWPLALRRRPPDLLLTLAFSPPLASTLPTVMTVHDVTPLERPGDYAPAARWYWRQVLREIAPRSRRILVPSEWARQRCAEVLGYPAERIDVVHSGVEPHFFADGSAREPDGVLSRLGVSEPFWLHCGVAHPRKNLEVAIRALALIRRRGHESPILLRVGSQSAYLERMRALARDLGVADRFLDAGSVNDRELAGLYARSAAFLYPSWAEGFGVPPLEAMASGAPVLASRITCLPEILGDTPFWGNPSEPESWVDAWDACASQSEEERRARADRAREWARRYTWDATAALCLGALRRAVESLS